MKDSTSPAAGAGPDTRIVRAAIHPAIGIARVGNSREAFYIGPQVADPAPRDPGFYRDATGALKREAAEFRVYGYNASGEVVRELTSAADEIAWEVHVANRKAAWYQWQIAMDIPDAAQTVLPLRNAKTAARKTLAIDAGVQRIQGAEAASVACIGQFTGVPVQIGELRTDGHGRLLFLPGFGISASPTQSPIFNENDGNTFINADGWYDDTCDGPVSATVRVDGQPVPVEGAWVVSAPPNYAPQVKAERTLYDLLYSLYVQAGWLPFPQELSFTRDVYPILQRLSGLQWVNQGFATQFGHNGVFDFENPALIARLAALPTDGGYDPNAEFRRQVFNSFRPAEPKDGNQMPWPWLYGDGMTYPAGPSPLQNASISQTQSDILSRWAAGHFKADWGCLPSPPDHIDAVPLQEQPAMLDRAALEFCLADAFHPGCELTWPMRHLTLYSAPFRIRRRPAGEPETDYGPTLDQATALSASGPLHAQGPGDLNRWMGLPWQADTAWCRAGYDTTYDPFAPAFWPARVPNQVLAEQDYAVVVDPNQPDARRIEAFTNRTNWNQPLHGTTAEVMTTMVRIFGSMGLVEVRPGVPDDARFPATMMVASYGPDVAPGDARSSSGAATAPSEEKARLLGAMQATGLGAAAAARPAGAGRPLPSGANFQSPDEARNAPRPVRRTPPRA